MSGNPQAYLQASDFTADLLALLPRGPAWEGPVLASLMAGAGDAFGDLHASLATLTELEMVPNTTTQLLPDWEFDFGLPDACTPLGDTIDQRRAALLAKMQALGGQSPGYFIGLAATLGFTITITKFVVARCGMRCGGRLFSLPWRYVWQVNVPGPAGSAGELVCRLSAYAPAYGRLIFVYTP